MKGSTWLALGLAGAALLVLAVATLWMRPDPPVDGPAPVPPGTTVEQRLPDAEGNPVVWKIRRHEVDGVEALRDAAVVPEPAPRETPTGEHTDSARALGERARGAWRTGDLPEAVSLFEAAVEADPDDWHAQADFGRLLDMMGVSERAYTHLDRAAALAPDEPRVWLDLLTHYSRHALIERSWEARRRAEELSGGRPIVQDPHTGNFIFEGDSVFP